MEGHKTNVVYWMLSIMKPVRAHYKSNVFIVKLVLASNKKTSQI